MTDTSRPIVVWFRQDLRLADNPALAAAVRSGRPVLPLYVLDDETPDVRPIGGAGRWWLAGSLTALAGDLAAVGGAPLVLRRGKAEGVIADLARETNAAAVHWNRCYEPGAIARDTRIKRALADAGVQAESHNGALLFEPWTVKTKAGGFFKVYTRYWQACRALGDPPKPEPAPERIAGHTGAASDDLGSWTLRPSAPDWAAEFGARWRPGERAALARLEDFLDDRLDGYATGRDVPSEPATSGLSAHLHMGEIGPRQIWHATLARHGWSAATEAFLKELVWREFAHHVLYHLPALPTEPMQPKFQAFPWAEDAAALRQWQKGLTGYPMVDAGMRELWRTGTMHNRVRMVVASFLVKHLLQPWQAGEAWFWDTLVDADLAANSFNWQWSAGCGADAQPYFRIFNPVAQGEKFDPAGKYVRTYVPEIAALPDKYLHAPWTAPDHVLAEAGIRLGETYPRPIVDHREARDRALAAFKSLGSQE